MSLPFSLLSLSTFFPHLIIIVNDINWNDYGSERVYVCGTTAISFYPFFPPERTVVANEILSLITLYVLPRFASHNGSFQVFEWILNELMLSARCEWKSWVILTKIEIPLISFWLLLMGDIQHPFTTTKEGDDIVENHKGSNFACVISVNENLNGLLMLCWV